MARYDYVLLDADRTLFDFDAGQKQALINTFSHHGLPSDDATRAVYVEENHKAWALFEQGKVTKDELTRLRFRTFLDRTGLQADPDSLNRFYLADLGTYCIPFESTEEVCRTLARHCSLYIITNGVSTVQHGRMSRCTFRDCFREMFVSEEMGCQKPQKEYFDVVAARIPGFDPARAIVVGDSPASDILGANNAGLDSCWYNPKGETMPEGITATYTIGDLRELPRLILK